MNWGYKLEQEASSWLLQQDVDVQEDILDLIETMCDKRLPPQEGEIYELRDFDQLQVSVLGYGSDGILIITRIMDLADD